MPSKDETMVIRTSKENAKRLRVHGNMHETYDEVLTKILDVYEMWLLLKKEQGE